MPQLVLSVTRGCVIADVPYVAYLSTTPRVFWNIKNINILFFALTYCFSLKIVFIHFVYTYIYIYIFASMDHWPSAPDTWLWNIYMYSYIQYKPINIDKYLIRCKCNTQNTHVYMFCTSVCLYNICSVEICTLQIYCSIFALLSPH